MNTKDMAPRERRWWKRHMRSAVRQVRGNSTFYQLTEEAKPFVEAIFRAVQASYFDWKARS